MAYVKQEAIDQARSMDLLTYLSYYEPGNLVRISGNTYCTREHDSLKISNGKWYWFSRRIGGVSALDYLMKVKEYSLPEAVELIVGCDAIADFPARDYEFKSNEERKQLGLNGRRKVEKEFDRNIVINKYLDAINKVTN